MMEAGKINLSPDAPGIGCEKEEEMGVLGTPVSGLPKGPDGIHILPGSRRMLQAGQEVGQLELEERRARPQTGEERRESLKGRIAANASSVNPHRHYFVRYPEL